MGGGDWGFALSTLGNSAWIVSLGGDAGGRVVVVCDSAKKKKKARSAINTVTCAVSNERKKCLHYCMHAIFDPKKLCSLSALPPSLAPPPPVSLSEHACQGRGKQRWLTTSPMHSSRDVSLRFAQPIASEAGGGGVGGGSVFPAGLPLSKR